MTGAMFLANGETIASWGWDNVVRFWDVASGQPTGAVLEHDGPVRDLAVSPDGRYLLTLTMTNNANFQLRIWDPAMGVQVVRHALGVGILNGAIWTPRGDGVVVWGEGQSVQHWPLPWLALGDPASAARRVCEDAMRGTAGLVETAAGPTWAGARRIAASDAQAAPLLRGRAGEDVCAWEPRWYDRLLDSAVARYRRMLD